MLHFMNRLCYGASMTLWGKGLDQTTVFAVQVEVNMTERDNNVFEKAMMDLRLIEAAVEGADMGDKELQNAISCKLLDVVGILREQPCEQCAKIGH